MFDVTWVPYFSSSFVTFLRFLKQIVLQMYSSRSQKKNMVARVPAAKPIAKIEMIMKAVAEPDTHEFYEPKQQKLSIVLCNENQTFS